MNPHHQAILERFQQTDPGRGSATQRPEHRAISRRWYGLTNAQHRQVILDFIKTRKDLSYDDWLALIDALYHGDSYEERCAPATLFRRFTLYRRQLPLSRLDQWLGNLEGWAEVDSTCQTVFTDKDMLADWDAWEALLESLSRDANINKRRAALVLLTAPITKSSDQRILRLSLRLIELLKSEKDKRITKAISWLLRKAIKQHRQAIKDYLDARAKSLPAIALRETRKKLTTGKK